MNVSLIAATVFLLLLKVAATATFYIHVLRSGVHTCTLHVVHVLRSGTCVLVVVYLYCLFGMNKNFPSL